MLRSMKDLEHYRIGALDGDVGHVEDFYFDDHAWVIRYLVVETGNWLSSRRVLISPISIHDPDWAARVLPVSITRAQVESSPDIETHLPVSRQHEMQYLGYYGYPYYWTGGGLWGAGLFPYAMAPGYGGIGPDPDQQSVRDRRHEAVERAIHRDDDPHLRSCKAVVGCHIHATDGDIGHVEGLLVDEETWAIRYLVIDTSNWWIGHKVLVAPEWSTGIDWTQETVTVRLTRKSIADAPSYDAGVALTRQHEALLHEHHRQTGYWHESDPTESHTE
ncbi:MAG: PRC-barrel domain-containing protein [Burkholderiaceae bacterium]